MGGARALLEEEEEVVVVAFFGRVAIRPTRFCCSHGLTGT